MKCTSLGAVALVFALAGTAIGQSTEDPPPRWVVQFERTDVSLDGLRDAIRSRDAERAAALISRAAELAQREHAEFGREIDAVGGRVREVFWLIPACVIEGPDAARDLAERYPGVRAVRADEWRHPAMLATRPIRVATDGDNHAADSVQSQGIRGAGVTVAVVDSGLDVNMGTSGRPHAVFFPGGNPGNTTGGGIGGSRILGNVQVGQISADDVIGHGTRVAAVAVGARWNTTASADDGHAPEAKLAGYSLCETFGGVTTLVTMVSAWQHVVADAASLGTKVAVVGYDGTPDPASPEQQAMDVAADVADLLVTAIAGNDPSSGVYYQGTVNALAVGATVANTHVLTWFSASGPLQSPGLVQRTYPHVLANGEDVILPTADNEAMNTMSSGTSYSAPQVAGAAALFRSVATQATGLQTRAAILATTEDVTVQNQAWTDSIGEGYLRDDRLIALAQGGGLLASGTVDVNQPGATFSQAVNAGETWSVVLSWSRHDVTAAQWANLDLRVSLNGQPVGESLRIDDSNERVVFDAPFGGTATIAVSAVRFESGRIAQDFAIAASPSVAPRIAAFGQGCLGSRGPLHVWSIEPDTLAAGTFGNTSSDLLIGNVDHRTQQWIDATQIPGAFNLRGLALRHDDVAAPLGQRVWVDLSIDLSLNNARVSTMTSTFAQNEGLRKARVLTRKKIVLPQRNAVNNDPNEWAVVIPFDQPYDRLYDSPPNQTPIQGLVVDVRKYGSSLGATAVAYPLDATQGIAAGTLFATSPTATTGTLTRNLATVIGLIDDLGAVHYPRLSGTGAPVPGGSYTIQLTDAAASVPGIITWGQSRQAYGPVPLPLDLGVIDAPGCWLYTSIETTSGVVTLTDGSASLLVPVPLLPALSGGRLHHQALTLDLGANAFGLTTSNGVTVVVGD